MRGSADLACDSMAAHFWVLLLRALRQKEATSVLILYPVGAEAVDKCGPVLLVVEQLGGCIFPIPELQARLCVVLCLVRVRRRPLKEFRSTSHAIFG